MSALPAKTSTTAPTSLAKRREQAIAIAQQCKQILIQEFAATEVTVFGSLRGDAPWHHESDIDLAVRGLSRDAIWEAYGRLESVVPGWLGFDIVAIERVDARVRDRILQASPMTENQYLALKQRLEDELYAIEKTVSILNELLNQASTVPKIALTPALASYIEDFYNGCERIAERVAVELDKGVPTGEHWHQTLMNQMAQPGGHGRPPVWGAELLQTLDVYRRFRHRVRHLYNLDLDDDKVLNMAERVPDAFSQLQAAIALFNRWLVAQA